MKVGMIILDIYKQFRQKIKEDIIVFGTIQIELFRESDLEFEQENSPLPAEITDPRSTKGTVLLFQINPLSIISPSSDRNTPSKITPDLSCFIVSIISILWSYPSFRISVLHTKNQSG